MNENEHEYRVRIKVLDVFEVYVTVKDTGDEDEDKKAAEDLAWEKYNDGKAELIRSDTEYEVED